MSFYDILALALRNLRQSKLRTGLTTLGVSIGIASLAGMVSLGVGLQDQVVGRFLQAGVFDAITVVNPSELGFAAALAEGRGGLRPGARGRGGLPGTPQPPAVRLDAAALKQISEMENVRDVYPNVRVPIQMALGEFSHLVFLTGVPMSLKNEGAFQTFSYGGFFAGDSDQTCVLNLNTAKQIDEQNPGSLIGKTATLSYASSKPADVAAGVENGFQQMVQRVDLQCRIAGIVERDANGLPIGGGPNASVMIPQGIAEKIEAEIITDPQSFLRDPSVRRSYGTVTVKVKQAKFTQDVEDRIRKMGFSAISVNDALRGAKNAFIILDIFLTLIGSIALAVSSLGIVNTMVMSILERTREIGIMKAVGASDSHIRRIFLIEASVIGVLGGGVGVAIGWTVGRVINFGVNIYIRTQGGTPGTFFFLPLWLIASAIGFSIVVSLIAGSYPASRAAQLDPIQALRHD
jgi:putative ABC transport system permease protein